MNRSTLKNRVVSGIVCLSLAAIGVVRVENGNSPVMHDGNAPRTAAQGQHLDDFKMSNPILDKYESLEKYDELTSLEL